MRRNVVGAQGADVHQMAHALGPAGAGDFFGQLAVHPVKACGRAVQYGHQVNHRVHASHGFGERRLVMHIAFQHGQARQMLHFAGVDRAPGGDADAKARAHQLFTHMGTDKTGAAQDQNMFHAGNCSG